MKDKVLKWFGSEKNFVLALFGAALLARLAYSLPLPDSKLSPDAFDWMGTAWDIAQGKGFGGSWRPPGWPYAMAAVFFVFGKSVAAVRVFNGLLGALTCVLTYRTGRRLFTENAGRIAGVLAAFYPYFVAYSGDLLSETFLTFMIALGVFLVVKAADEPSWKNVALAGAGIGLAGLTKSVILPFFALAGLWVWWRTGKFRHCLALGAVAALTIMPWSLRNYFHYDKSYVMPVSSPWCSLAGSNCDEAILNETVGDQLKDNNAAPIDQFLPKGLVDYIYTLPLPERDKYCKNLALTWIDTHPAQFRTLLRLRAKHFWRLYPMIAYRWEKLAAMATSGVYFPLALIGVFLARGLYRKTSLLLALFAAYTAVHICFATMIRYRVPIDPYVLMFTGFTLERAWNALKARYGGAAA